MLQICALAIGGLDPGGGAGIVADLRGFQAAGVFGCAVVALQTVQSTEGLRASVAVDSRLVIRQAEEVLRAQRVGAVKIGALGSIENVRAVTRWLSRRVTVSVVLDPVILPTRGASRLLASRALGAMRDEMLPQATLVTANATEAAVLTGQKVHTVADARAAAASLATMTKGAALVKAGHLAASEDAVDVLVVGGRTIELRSRRMTLPATHGGGCVLASLIAGFLARTDGAPGDVLSAVRRARRIHQRALRDSVDVGGAMRVLVP